MAVVKMEEFSEQYLEESFEEFLNLGIRLNSSAYEVMSRGSLNKQSTFINIFEKNLVHDGGFLHWAGWFARITTTGSTYHHTFRSPNNKKYSFIGVAGVNKGRQSISAQIEEGGVGSTVVKIKFGSGVPGAWHIFVVFATDDPDVKALQ